MTPEQLLAQLRRFYESGEMSQRDVAQAVGMSPSGLADAMSSRNKLTGIQVLKIQEFLESMSAIPARPIPKTLAEAKEQLRDLEQQEQALQARLDEHIRLGHKPRATPPAASPGNSARSAGIQANARNDGFQNDDLIGTKNPNKLPTSGERPRAVRLPVEADTPFLAGEILKRTNAEDLRSMLASERDPDRRSWIYKEICGRRGQ